MNVKRITGITLWVNRLVAVIVGVLIFAMPALLEWYGDLLGYHPPRLDVIGVAISCRTNADRIVEYGETPAEYFGAEGVPERKCAPGTGYRLVLRDRGADLPGGYLACVSHTDLCGHYGIFVPGRKCGGLHFGCGGGHPGRKRSDDLR